LGDGIKKCTKSEENVKKIARKSIVAASYIPKGTVIEENMLTIKRPGTGIPPKFIDYLIGKKAKIDILKDTVLDLSMVE
jgi:N-acetylneuraminate synthase/N,N'-diacetyllegionaminate synthase